MRLVEDPRSTLYSNIRDKIAKMDPATCNRLPPEPELAKRFNIGRSVLRRILQHLENEGVIERRKGSGTLVFPSAIRAGTRIENEMSFPRLIAASGHTPKLVRTGHSWRQADEISSRILGIGPEEEIAIVETTLYSDKHAAVYVVHRIPKKFFARIPDGGFIGPVFDLVRTFCEREIHHSIAWFKSRNADSRIAQNLCVPEGTPIVMWEEVHYDVKDEAICVSEDFFNTEVLPICTLRRMSGYSATSYLGQV